MPEKGSGFRVKATTEIADFNDAFGTTYSDEDFDTVGGLVISRFGHLPKRGEQIAIDELNFRVLRADSRRLHVLRVERVKEG
jgi:magnesium and cobalt transporter